MVQAVTIYNTACDMTNYDTACDMTSYDTACDVTLLITSSINVAHQKLAAVNTENAVKNVRHVNKGGAV